MSSVIQFSNNDTADGPEQVRCFSHLQSLAVSLFSLASFHFFFRTSGKLCRASVTTHKLPQYLRKNFFLPCYARCVLSFLLHWTRSSARLLSLKNGRIENPWCRAGGHLTPDASHVILLCPATNS